MEEGIVDIELIKVPVTSCSNEKNTTNCNKLGNEGESVMVVEALNLSVSLGN